MAGGPPTVVASITGASRGASWGPDDAIVFATSDPTTGLLRVAAGGGEPEVLTRPDANNGEHDHLFPSVLPGGRGVLFTVSNRSQQLGAAVLDLRTRRWRTVIRSGSQAEYVETGHVIYMDGGALWAVRFDVANLEIDGDPVAVIERVGRRQTAANLVLSRRGTLAYSPASDNDDRSLVWVDRQGREQPIMAPVRRYGLPRLSTDGSRIAVSMAEGERGSGFWIWDFSLQALTPLSGRSGGFSVWSPDNRHLIFNAPAGGAGGAINVFRRAVNGTGAVQRLTSSDAPQRPVAISPDGKHLLIEQQTPESAHHLMVLSLDSASTSAGARRIAPLLDSPSDERNASIAPDGRWMAYESNKKGQSQIYVTPFPNVNDAEYQISTAGGRSPLWAAGGRELFFVNGSALMATPVQVSPAFRAGNPTPLFESRSLLLEGRLIGNSGRAYDVARDGRFLTVKFAAAVAGAQAGTPGIIVVQNWLEELKQRVPTR